MFGFDDAATAIGSANQAVSGLSGIVNGLGSMFGGGSSPTRTFRKIFNYQHARAVEDMRLGPSRQVEALNLAGLNPALAYGGFGGPTNSLPSVPNPSFPPDYAINKINSAREGMLASATVKKLEADTAAAESVAELNRANAIRTAVQTQIDTSSAGLAKINLDREEYLRDVFQSFFVAGREMDARLDKAIFERLKASNDYNTIEMLNMFSYKHGYGHNFEAALREQGFRQLLQDYAFGGSRLKHSDLDLDRARALSGFYKTDFGKDIAPFINSAGGIADIVGTGVNVFKRRSPFEFSRKR